MRLLKCKTLQTLVTTFWVRSDDVNIGDVVVLELIHILICEHGNYHEIEMRL